MASPDRPQVEGLFGKFFSRRREVEPSGPAAISDSQEALLIHKPLHQRAKGRTEKRFNGTRKIIIIDQHGELL
ncbi:hypothetical protein HYS90_02220 [Candidatus Curtissbacteria bacterium]|nr:hypothetical protein [Candidatus Curtissbacteria bacterium]